MKVTELGAEQYNAHIWKSCGWKKRSIFWDLPYWKSLLIRHNLDVMHIEKNVFENVINTVMNVEGRTKDNAKARDDVKLYCRRPELERDERIGRYQKTCYSLGREEKKVLCECVMNLRFPDGYAQT